MRVDWKEQRTPKTHTHPLPPSSSLSRTRLAPSSTPSRSACSTAARPCQTTSSMSSLMHSTSCRVGFWRQAACFPLMSSPSLPHPQDTDKAHELRWLPNRLPANIHLIASTASVEHATKLSDRGWRTVQMPSFSMKERHEVRQSSSEMMHRKNMYPSPPFNNIPPPLLLP